MPLSKTSSLTIPIATRLTERDYQALLDSARLQGLTQTELIRTAIRQHLITSETLVAEVKLKVEPRPKPTEFDSSILPQRAPTALATQRL